MECFDIEAVVFIKIIIQTGAVWPDVDQHKLLWFNHGYKNHLESVLFNKIMSWNRNSEQNVTLKLLFLFKFKASQFSKGSSSEHPETQIQVCPDVL